MLCVLAMLSACGESSSAGNLPDGDRDSDPPEWNPDGDGPEEIDGDSDASVMDGDGEELAETDGDPDGDRDADEGERSDGEEAEGEASEAECEPDCNGKECGPDGCNGDCGECPTGYQCNADRICVASCSDDDPFPPDRVYFRTATRSFNLKWYVVLDEGRIWVKPNEETGGTGDWRMLGATGMPEGNDLPNFGPPGSLVEISADGVHLHALSDTGAFYRGSDMTTDIHFLFNWTDRWGGVGANGDGLMKEFSTQYGWSVADSHPFGVHHYEDPNGMEHSVGMGVAHLYRLGPDGREIFFNDWWLPNDWSRQICGPNRSTFKALSISVSASTLFLIGEGGRMYTRLYDFDTGGENSLLTYSYIVSGPAGTTRKLPAEDWRRQPDIEDGLITDKITIFQNGQGNAARVLRVEGIRNGISGFYSKGIYDSNWSFQETGRTVCGPFLNDSDASSRSSDPVSPSDRLLSGELTLDAQSIGIEVRNFNMICSPAEAHLQYLGQTVTADGEPLVFELHHVHTMVNEKRPTRYWLQGIPAFVQAALPIPDSIGRIDDPEARQYVVNLFGTRKVVNFLGYALPDSVDLSEIMWTEPFRVPAEEKAFLSGFHLSLTAP